MQKSNRRNFTPSPVAVAMASPKGGLSREEQIRRDRLANAKKGSNEAVKVKAKSRRYGLTQKGNSSGIPCVGLARFNPKMLSRHTRKSILPAQLGVAAALGHLPRGDKTLPLQAIWRQRTRAGSGDRVARGLKPAKTRVTTCLLEAGVWSDTDNDVIAGKFKGSHLGCQAAADGYCEKLGQCRLLLETLVRLGEFSQLPDANQRQDKLLHLPSSRTCCVGWKRLLYCLLLPTKCADFMTDSARNLVAQLARNAGLTVDRHGNCEEPKR